MIHRMISIPSVGRLNKSNIKNVKNTNLLCGRNTCLCLLNLNLDSKKEKKYYNLCYKKWYNYNMMNMLEFY